MTSESIIRQIDSKDYYEQIFTEFGKSKEDVEEYINILKKWADDQPHFPEKPSRNVLRFVVLYNKFSIERAKEKLDMYYTMRGLVPEILGTSPLSSDLLFQQKLWFTVPLPKPANDGARIIFMAMNPEYRDPKYFNHNHAVTQFIHLLEYLAEYDLCYRFHYILDYSNVTMGHAALINIMALRKALIIMEKVFSNRLSSINFLHFPSFLEIVLNAIKPFISLKLQERMQFHSGSNILIEKFGKERMPVDIGGEERSLKELSELMIHEYHKYKDRFDKLAELKVDESLRPAKLKNDDILGYYGNFKKINVD